MIDDLVLTRVSYREQYRTATYPLEKSFPLPLPGTPALPFEGASERQHTWPLRLSAADGKNTKMIGAFSLDSLSNWASHVDFFELISASTFKAFGRDVSGLASLLLQHQT